MPKKKDKKIRPWIIVLPILAILIAGAWQLVVRFEGEAPEILIGEMPTALGTEQVLSFNVSEKKSGLRKVWVGVLQNGKETVILEKKFPRDGFLGGSGVTGLPVEINLSPKEVGMTDGEAVLRISVWDYSWRDRWRGNVAYIEQTLLVDTKPAQIEVLSDAHNITQGGAGLIVYRLSEACPRSGVQVGDNYFPGMVGYFQDPQVYLCLFALGHDQGSETALSVTAEDVGGNLSRAGFYHHIQKKSFKTDIINISDNFLGRKLPEFDVDREGALSAVEKFLKVNGDMRKENFNTIVGITGRTEAVMYWRGKFERLPSSATRATFAEARDYKYSGKTIDKQTHLGIDLASVANAPIPAANSGRVAFTGQIGIYGKTVIIDHGYGLFSLYSHLSSIAVTEDQILDRGEILGRTGTTGMAGGDHLHFSVLVHNTFVNPVEWWDDSWIENNITSKLSGQAAIAN
jgi:hypothetical protein